MSKTRPASRVWSPARLGCALGAVTGLAVLLTLGDPGLTTDEPLDVLPGRRYVQTLQMRGLGFFERSTVARVFADNAEHPPLGRWLLGIASVLGQPFEVMRLGPDPLGMYVLSARLAPASAFAVLVGLIVHTATRRYGTAAGFGAGFALGVMPRAFAHAHLGALDTFISLFWTAALLAADRALTSRRPVAAMAAAGGVWGLALLTKIHAWFLIPVVLVWAFVRLSGGRSRRPLAAFAVWAAAGLGVFLLGWPWLWYETGPRLLRYLGTGIDRAPIRVLYFGTVYADRDVPWHYPWLYFAVSVPVGLHLLGAVGLANGWKARRDDPFPLLIAGSIAMFLGLFSTRIPVYDGERLFSIVFPLWAVFIGRGFGEVWGACSARRWLRAGLVATLAAQATGVVALHPFGLSYYNALVGGLPGAQRLGLELTYWGDAVDGVLLDHLVRVVPPGESAALIPTLYPGQGIATTTRAMARLPVLLGDEETVSRAAWAVVSRRSTYWQPDFRERFRRGRVVYERRRQGVWLSAIVRLSPELLTPAGTRPNVATSP